MNLNDPSGLCAVMIAGITMGPGSNSAWDNEGLELQADMAYPYAGMGYGASIDSVHNQLYGPNQSTYSALRAITFALGTNIGPIDIMAYSGGAAAFTVAYGMLTQYEQQRINQILYLTPGLGILPAAASNGNTSTIMGSYADKSNLGANVFHWIGAGSVTYANCKHTDVQCFLNNSSPQLSTMLIDGDCATPFTTTENDRVKTPPTATVPVSVPLFSRIGWDPSWCFLDGCINSEELLP